MSRPFRLVSLIAGCVVLGALAVGPSSCNTPPTREQVMDVAGGDLPPVSAKPGLLPDDEALRRAAPTGVQQRFVRRLHAIESAATHRPLVPGNQVTLLVDGPATHDAQLAAIARARHHVHLIAYILADDSVGRKYRDALGARARAGVAVRLMFDSIGALEAGPEFRQALQDAGVALHEYAPINPLEQPELWRISQRNHRKILVVDGRVAFTGGIGISDSYSTSPLSGSGGSESGWRDTHIRITGPAVAEFQRLFIEDWQSEEGPIPDAAEYWPELAQTGDELVRAISNDGKDASELLLSPVARLLRELRGRDRTLDENAIYASYLAAIGESHRRVWITQAYFAPNREFLNVLESGNLDYRSFIHNDEANASIVGHAFAREMEQMFLDDLVNAHEVRRDAWRERPLTDRVLQTLASSLKVWI